MIFPVTKARHPIQIAAIGLVLVLSEGSEASLIQFENQDIPIPTTASGVSINLETGALGDALGADASFFFGGLGVSNDAYTAGTAPTWQPVRIGTGNLDAIDNLTAGTLVGPGSTYGTDYGGSGLPNPHLGVTFTEGVPGYLGFSLDSGGTILFGWMRVTLANNTAGGLIHEWAIEDSGAPLTVDPGAAVPEASQVAIFILGALGIAAHRRRSRQVS